MDKKQLYDKQIFEKAIKIIKSKSEKPEGDYFSRQVKRYEEAFEQLDVIGCAKVLNELKIHFDGSKVEQKSVSLEMFFVKALRILAEVYSYHNGDQRDKHWENTTKILKSLNISEDHERFKELKNFFRKKN